MSVRTTPSRLVTLTGAPAPGRPMLALLHAVSGSVLPYLALAAHVGLPAVAVEARGLHGGPCDMTLDDAAAACADALSSLPGPVLLAGWSLGGSLAFEVASRLRAAGRDALGAVLVDADPDWREPAPTPDELVLRYLEDVFASAGRPVPAGALDAPVGDDPVGRCADVLVTSGLVPERARADVGRRVAVYCSLATAFAAYRPQPTDVPLVLVSTRASAELQHEAWSALGRVHAQIVLDADHYSVLRPEHAPVVAEALELWSERLSHGR